MICNILEENNMKRKFKVNWYVEIIKAFALFLAPLSALLSERYLLFFGLLINSIMIAILFDIRRQTYLRTGRWN